MEDLGLVFSKDRLNCLMRRLDPDTEQQITFSQFKSEYVYEQPDFDGLMEKLLKVQGKVRSKLKPKFQSSFCSTRKQRKKTKIKKRKNAQIHRKSKSQFKQNKMLNSQYKEYIKSIQNTPTLRKKSFQVIFLNIQHQKFQTPETNVPSSSTQSLKLSRIFKQHSEFKKKNSNDYSYKSEYLRNRRQQYPNGIEDKLDQLRKRQLELKLEEIELLKCKNLRDKMCGNKYEDDEISSNSEQEQLLQQPLNYQQKQKEDDEEELIKEELKKEEQLHKKYLIEKKVKPVDQEDSIDVRDADEDENLITDLTDKNYFSKKQERDLFNEIIEEEKHIISNTNKKTALKVEDLNNDESDNNSNDQQESLDMQQNFNNNNYKPQKMQQIHRKISFQSEIVEENSNNTSDIICQQKPITKLVVKNQKYITLQQLQKSEEKIRASLMKQKMQHQQQHEQQIKQANQFNKDYFLNMEQNLKDSKIQEVSSFLEGMGNSIQIIKSFKDKKQLEQQKLDYSEIIYETPEQQKQSNLKSVSSNKNIQTPVKSLKQKNPRKIPQKQYYQEFHLVKCLQKQIELDKKVDQIRFKLSQRNDFNLCDAFKLFDQKGRGLLSTRELEMGFKLFNISVNKEDIFVFMKKYDLDFDGLLTYDDFSRAISPAAGSSSQILQLKSSNSQMYTPTDETTLNVFKDKTNKMFKKLLKQLIVTEVKIEQLRQQLYNNERFNIYNSFKSLDVKKAGFVSIGEIKYLMNNYGFNCQKQDLIYILDRYDKNKNNKISYSEFLQEITPKSPEKY